MPAELPTIASCPHCGTILLRTPRVLVHPMSGERDRIRRALGGFWFEQSRTRFDGRLHRCPGRGRAAATPAGDAPISSARRGWVADSAHEDGARRAAGRGGTGTRTTSILAVTVSLMVAVTATAQEDLGPWRLGRAELARQADRFGGGGVPAALGELSKIFDVDSGSKPFDAAGLPTRRGAGPETLSRDRTLAVAGGSYRPCEATGPAGPDSSWRGLELACGRYQVVDTIREDEAGVVYLAHDRNLDAHVDVEVPSLSQDEAPSSTVDFVRAVRSLARLGHPHLVKVTEVGTYRDAPFVVAEHLAGGSLKFRRPVGAEGRPAPVAPGTLQDWLTDVASALDYLHSQGRVYREVSPASIRFDAQGRAYLGGLAMSEAVAERMDATPGGGRESLRSDGPAATLAPEILEGAKPDGRADQYALAATVYELLSGRPPFPSHTRAGIAMRQSTSEPQELSRVNPSVSRSLSSAVHRGLSRDPRDRYASCSAFARAVLSAASAIPPAAIAAGRGTRRDDGRAKHANDGRPGPAGSYVALGLACSTVIAVVGVKARRRPRRPRAASHGSAPRQVAGRRLRKLVERIGFGKAVRRIHALGASPKSRNPSEAGPDLGAAAIFPVQAIGSVLSRRHELSPSPERPGGHLSENLLPVPYLLSASAAPEGRRHASATVPDGLASRKAS